LTRDLALLAVFIMICRRHSLGVYSLDRLVCDVDLPQTAMSVARELIPFVVWAGKGQIKLS